MDFFYCPRINEGEHVLDEEESRHCARVLRKKKGDQVIVLDGLGTTYACRLTEVHQTKTPFEVVKKVTSESPEYYIHLAIAPTKNIDRMEWLLEKTIEIGIRQISFLLCANSERKLINRPRMLKKAISAIKQSGNPFLPIIDDMQSYSEFIRNHAHVHEKYICNAATGYGNYLLHKASPSSRYLILVGPEGDFSEDELKIAEKNGFAPVSLGNTRLRTETAGLVACILLHALNTNR